MKHRSQRLMTLLAEIVSFLPIAAVILFLKKKVNFSVSLKK